MSLTKHFSLQLFKAKIILIVCLVLMFENANAQTSCSLGDPVFEENFGSGSSRLGPSLNQDPNNVHPDFRPADLYTYVGTGNVGQDQYGIMKNPKDAAPGGASWNDDFPDHTGNTNGYLYYCDAKEDFNVFYAQKISGLCPEIEYELSAWFAKTNAPDYYIDPNIKLIVGFTDINDQNLGIVDVNTGPIEGVGSNRWHRKTLVFTTPKNTENVYFMLKNNVAGVAGNDLAIDDIQVRPCGPQLEITNIKTQEIIAENATICLLDPTNYLINLNTNIPPTFALQWQESVKPNLWVDIPNKTTSTLSYDLGISQNNNHKIRLKFAHNNENLMNNNCHFFSNEITFNKLFSNAVNSIEMCDNLDDGDATNGIIQNFDLESQSASILGDLQSGPEYSVTYHLSENDAESGIKPLSSPHTNNASPNLQTIYVRVENKTTGCIKTNTSFDLIVTKVPFANQVNPIEVCDDLNDADSSNGIVQIFDLESQTSTILGPSQAASDYTVSYHLSKTDAQTGTAALLSPHSNNSSPGIQTIFVRVQNNVTKCINSELSFDLIVNSLPSANPINPIEICDNLNDGDDTNGIVQNINLEDQTLAILGNNQTPSNFIVTYHLTSENAVSGNNPISSPHANTLNPNLQTIYVRIQDKITSCINSKYSFDIIVHPLPSIANSVVLKQCDNDTDGFSVFNLTEVNNEISSNASNEVFTYYRTSADAISELNPILNPTNYTNKTVSIDTVWAKVTSQQGCSKISEIILNVSTTGIPFSFQKSFSSCDDNLDINGVFNTNNDDRDGIASFDFSSVTNEVLDIFPKDQQLTVNYYRNEVDALSESNKIEDISNYRNIGYSGSQQIYIRVDSAVDNDCLGLGPHITLNVQPLPNFTVASDQIICKSGPNSKLQLSVNLENPLEIFEYEWTDQNNTLLSTESTLEVTQAGTYAIHLYNTIGTRCFRTETITVSNSEPAIIEINDIKIESYNDNNTILIDNSNLGSGVYEFSLDEEFMSYQDAPVFDNVSAGIHTIYVRDKNGCGTSSVEVSVLGFPRFFTPNNDGYNDKWKISGVNSKFYSSAKIYIFNRFGKSITQFNVKNEGWNGLHNGKLLPSSDYWFRAELIDLNGNTTTKSGHFSLIRK